MDIFRWFWALLDHDFHWSAEMSQPPMRERDRTGGDFFHIPFFCVMACVVMFSFVTLDRLCPSFAEVLGGGGGFFYLCGMGWEKLDISHKKICSLVKPVEGEYASPLALSVVRNCLACENFDRSPFFKLPLETYLFCCPWKPICSVAPGNLSVLLSLETCCPWKPICSVEAGSVHPPELTLLAFSVQLFPTVILPPSSSCEI